jgi:pilus assembly protein CpaE
MREPAEPPAPEAPPPPPPAAPPPAPEPELVDLDFGPGPSEPNPPAALAEPPPQPEPPTDLLADIDGPDDDSPLDLVEAGPEPAPQVARPARPTRSVGNGTIITVMAGKGGSGKTVTATNLAMALTASIGEDRVCVLDADLQFGDVALLLQLDPSRTIVDAAEAIDDLTEPRLDGLLLRHESGLRVLSAPLAPSSSEQVPPKTVVRLMEMLQGMYEYVVVDTSPIFDDALMTVLDHSDEVVLVVDMDLPSVKNAKIALDTLRTSGYPLGRVHLLVNRVNSKARLDLVELERALGMEVAASVPSDRLVPQSVNEGIPAVAMSPRSKVAKAFGALAELFLP